MIQIVPGVTAKVGSTGVMLRTEVQNVECVKEAVNGVQNLANVTAVMVVAKMVRELKRVRFVMEKVMFE